MNAGTRYQQHDRIPVPHFEIHHSYFIIPLFVLCIEGGHDRTMIGADSPVRYR
jgi:hypothetical protein